MIAQPVEPLRVAVAIGDGGGPRYELSLNRSVYAAPSRATVLVSQADKGEIREFDSSGKWVRTYGKAGSGPGEFQAIHGLRENGDTITVVDSKLRRVTQLTRAGQSFTHQATKFPPRARMLGSTSTGALVYLEELNSYSLAQGNRATSAVIQDLSTSRELATRRIVAGSSVWGVATNGLSVVGLKHLEPVSRDGLVAISPSGQRVVIVNRNAPDGPGIATQSVEVMTAAGKPFARFEVRRTAIAVDRVLVDEELARLAKNVMRLKPGAFPSEAAVIENARDQLGIPKYHPIISGVVVDSDSTMWIAESRPMMRAADEGSVRVASVVWNRVDLSGRVLRRVRVPEGIELIAARGDVIWGTTENDDGIPLVVRLDR